MNRKGPRLPCSRLVNSRDARNFFLFLQRQLDPFSLRFSSLEPIISCIIPLCTEEKCKFRFGPGTGSFQILQNSDPPTTLEQSTYFLRGSHPTEQKQLDFSLLSGNYGSFAFLQWLWCKAWVLAHSIQWQAMRESTD